MTNAENREELKQEGDISIERVGSWRQGIESSSKQESEMRKDALTRDHEGPHPGDFSDWR